MRELDKICESYPVEAACMPLIVNCIYGEGQAKSAPKEAVNIFIVETMALHNHAYPKTLKDGRGNIRLVLIVTP